MTIHSISSSRIWPEDYAEVPKEVFQNEELYQQELKQIFGGPEWHAVAHIAEIPNPGDYKTFRLGEAPILVVRGDDQIVRVFDNSCPHRGTQLKTDSRGHGQEIECPYHRWLFTNAGSLLAAPSMNCFPAKFRKENYGLKEIRSKERFGIVFVTRSPDSPSIDKYLSVVDSYIARALGNTPLTFLGYQKVKFSTNWKEYGDQEGYHAPLLHKAFSLLRWQGGKGTRSVSEYGHQAVNAELQQAPDNGFLRDISLIRVKMPGALTRSVVISLFPLTTVLRHLDVITVRFAFPISVHATEVHYAYFSEKDEVPEMVTHRVRQASNLLGPSGFISLEDGAVFNRLHVGSATEGAVTFQKGVNGRLEAPCEIGQNDEHGNLVKWERYRELMGFHRE